MIGLDFDNFPTSAMSDEALVSEPVLDFSFSQPRDQYISLNEGVEDTLFNETSFEQAPSTPSTPIQPIQTQALYEEPISSSPVVKVEQKHLPTATKRSAPVERETKVKKRKQQHQQKDKERRHRINDGLKLLGSIVQSATGTFTRLDQPTIVSSSIGLIRSLQSELTSLRAQLSQLKDKESKEDKPDKPAVRALEPHQSHHVAETSPNAVCPVFSSVAHSGVALIMIRADDLSIVEANSVLANILGYMDSRSFVGTPVWDRPLHSRLYQLDRHGRVVHDSRPFSFGQAKIKSSSDDLQLETASGEDDSHIDCLWTARTATGNTLSARVTLSVLKGDDAKPTHFLLCSLPSQRAIATPSPNSPAVILPTEVEVAC
jgi:PAS domain-containing protein